MYAHAPSTSSRVKTVEAKIENMSVATKMAPKQISRKIPFSESPLYCLRQKQLSVEAVSKDKNNKDTLIRTHGNDCFNVEYT